MYVNIYIYIINSSDVHGHMHMKYHTRKTGGGGGGGGGDCQKKKAALRKFQQTPKTYLRYPKIPKYETGWF